MTATIVNAAPMTIMLGTQDLSTRALVAEAEVLPSHLPKIYGYAKKGPTTPQLVVGASRSQLYGDDSFDPRMPWATHATELSNIVNAQGNSQMFQRVKPIDAGPVASVRLYLDVLPTSVPEYQRNFDGSLTLDSAGAAIATGTKVAGFKAKWVVGTVTLDAETNESTFGTATQIPGDQTDTTTSIQSIRYPVMDVEVPDFGSYGNDNGLRLWAPTINSTTPLDDRLLATEKVYPFRMACVRRLNALTTPRIVETTSAEQFVNVCFKPNVIDPNTTKLVYAGDVFIDAYQTLNDPAFPAVYGPFGKMKMYDNNIEMLLAQFYAAELPLIDSFSDFKGVDGEEFLFNMITGVSSNAVPYHSFQLVSGTGNSIRLTENSTLYATGGSDGTMDESLFAELVKVEVTEYANPNSILQDTARYPESIIYDSGFPLPTKYALANFIALRKDTAVILSTHSVTGPVLSASEESSLAIALRTRLQMFPESDFFGTSTMRAMIIGRCGKLTNSMYRKKLPLTLEIADKAARYMGSGDGRWKAGQNFDHAPASEVTMFTDVNVTFTPSTVRNKDWAAGLNWVETYSRRSLYFPALKTVCDNDTSVLNSFFTMMCCVELEKVGERARRQFSGVSSLTNGQLVERVNKFVEDNTRDRFDNRFVIKPDAFFTAADIARGYSWTLPIKIYADNMKTVMTLSIESHRSEELTA